jgi:hypothetical protein
MTEKEKRSKARQEPSFRASSGGSRSQEAEGRLKTIERALQDFPKVVKQNAARGKAHQKLMKAFEPMAKDLARRVKKQAKST